MLCVRVVLTEYMRRERLLSGTYASQAAGARRKAVYVDID